MLWVTVVYAFLLPSSILSTVWMYHSLSIHPVIDVCICSIWAFVNKRAMHIYVQMLVWT